ncbi:MAG: hypothetical protein MUE46_02840 [Xanthomonadales bacterium]|nr:hypothetical protein [Xanthomonadales bacterium]
MCRLIALRAKANHWDNKPANRFFEFKIISRQRRTKQAVYVNETRSSPVVTDNSGRKLKLIFFTSAVILIDAERGNSRWCDVQHCPCAHSSIDGSTVMHLTRADGDQITLGRHHWTMTTGGPMGSGRHESKAELIMTVAWERVVC